MARHAHRADVYIDGRRARSVSRAAALILADREAVIERAKARSATRGTQGQLMKRDSELNAGLGGRRRTFHPERRKDIVMIGNTVDAAMTRVEEWPNAHDRRAVTVTAGGRVWIPNPKQAARRARQMAAAAGRTK